MSLIVVLCGRSHLFVLDGPFVWWLCDSVVHDSDPTFPRRVAILTIHAHAELEPKCVIVRKVRLNKIYILMSGELDMLN
jgi:hypothetical protein